MVRWGAIGFFLPMFFSYVSFYLVFLHFRHHGFLHHFPFDCETIPRVCQVVSLGIDITTSHNSVQHNAQAEIDKGAELCSACCYPLSPCFYCPDLDGNCRCYLSSVFMPNWDPFLSETWRQSIMPLEGPLTSIVGPILMTLSLPYCAKPIDKILPRVLSTNIFVPLRMVYGLTGKLDVGGRLSEPPRTLDALFREAPGLWPLSTWSATLFLNHLLPFCFLFSCLSLFEMLFLFTSFFPVHVCFFFSLFSHHFFICP